MRIHHLDCGNHRPIGGPIYDNRACGLYGDICTHCLLIELADSLVLVDTGYGLRDLTNAPQRRLAHLWPLVLNPCLSEEATATRQVEALGFAAHDVRHIILTHLDFDHAGGLADFPEAAVPFWGPSARQPKGNAAASLSINATGRCNGIR